MGFRYQRSRRIGQRSRLNLSKSGVSVSHRTGRLTLNSRGRSSVRIARGLSYRGGKGATGYLALASLVVGLVSWAFRLAAGLLRLTVGLVAMAAVEGHKGARRNPKAAVGLAGVLVVVIVVLVMTAHG